jgi:DNA-binding NarL/FixJ family response regulator
MVGRRRSPDIWFNAMDANVPPRPDVSRRENEVLRLPEEMTTPELAEKLKVSERTIEGIYAKVHQRLRRVPTAAESKNEP